jgi:hypothetical protein
LRRRDPPANNIPNGRGERIQDRGCLVKRQMLGLFMRNTPRWAADNGPTTRAQMAVMAHSSTSAELFGVARDLCSLAAAMGAAGDLGAVIALVEQAAAILELRGAVAHARLAKDPRGVDR